MVYTMQIINIYKYTYNMWIYIIYNNMINNKYQIIKIIVIVFIIYMYVYI